ncbi:holo-ACP synthase [Streptomyces sp. NPDC055107]
MWIGVDVLQAGELDRLLRRDWFRAYVYAPEELAVAAGFGEDRAREFLTGRFAGKEAALKVIGTGFGSGVTPRQIAILRSGGGAPVVRLSGRAERIAADAGMAGIHLSITHKKGMVVAAAMGVPRYAGQSFA